MADPIREAIHAWIREDVPLAGKMNLMPKHVEALIAKLAALRSPQGDEAEASQWQPIETAPKDGTLFLAYAEEGQHDLPAMYSLCAWHPDAGFCICELREPTHWQPLSAPFALPQRSLTKNQGGENAS